MAGGRPPCLLEYGLVSLMIDHLRVLGWITKAAQFSGWDAKCGTQSTCLDKIMVPNEKTNYDNNCVRSGSP